MKPPQLTPTTSMLRSRMRLAASCGIEPSAKPMTSSRPSGAMQRGEASKRSPPTGSKTTSTPRPPVSSLAAATQSPPESIVSSAPASRATAAFSSLETTAMTRAPSPLPT